MHRLVIDEEDEERRDDILEVMLIAATPEGHQRVYVHQKSCEWKTIPGQPCPCKPNCILVLPAAFA